MRFYTYLRKIENQALQLFLRFIRFLTKFEHTHNNYEGKMLFASEETARLFLDTPIQTSSKTKSSISGKTLAYSFLFLAGSFFLVMSTSSFTKNNIAQSPIENAEKTALRNIHKIEKQSILFAQKIQQEWSQQNKTVIQEKEISQEKQVVNPTPGLFALGIWIIFRSVIMKLR